MKNKTKSGKIITNEKLFDMIMPGSRIFLSSGAAMPVKTVSAILKSNHANLIDLEFVHLITLEDYFSKNTAANSNYRLKTFMVGEAISKGINAGNVDFVPSNISEIPYLFSSEAIGIDIAIIQTSPPDESGYLNLGIITIASDLVIKKAPLVIAEINPNVPVTHGQTSIHIDQIDYLIESDQPLIESRKKQIFKIGDKNTDKIGWHISNLIDDDSTVSLHYGPIFDAIAANLKSKKGLRIYTHLVSDWIIDLIESGVIALDRGVDNQRAVTSSCCYGSKKLYNFVSNNPSFEFAPLLNSTYQSAIAKIQKLIGIINAKRVDVSGDLVELYSMDSLLFGFDSKLNFSMAAAQSRGGKAIVAVHSIDQDGNSNIVIKHKLKEQSRIRSTLGSTQYVVTEFGVANLLGKSIRERTLAMIDIAHPDHRGQLLDDAKIMGYLYPDQIYVIENAINYPFNLETTKTFKEGTLVKFRPIKPMDEDMMRRLFYQFSNETKYMRYFAIIRSMPHDKMQHYVNIDYEKVLSLVGIVSQRGNERIIAEARYSYDEGEDNYELAFVVDEKYHNKGIGNFLFKYLLEIAKGRGLTDLVANVLTENEKMIKIFKNSDFKPEMITDEDVIQFIFDLN